MPRCALAAAAAAVVLLTASAAQVYAQSGSQERGPVPGQKRASSSESRDSGAISPQAYQVIRKWSNVGVLERKFSCVTLPYRGAPSSHRIRLRPKNVDVDLWVYGYGGASAWYEIDSSTNSDLDIEVVTFDATTRSTYEYSIIACAWGYGGNGRFDLTYSVE